MEDWSDAQIRKGMERLVPRLVDADLAARAVRADSPIIAYRYRSELVARLGADEAKRLLDAATAAFLAEQVP